MVHALGEIRRTLGPRGILIDLRPFSDRWRVEAGSSSGWQEAGRLSDQPIGTADDEAAFRAMREAESDGWFIKQKEETFDFFYYWDTPSEMREYLESEWADFEKLEEEVYRKTSSLWVSAGADARVRVRVKMHLARWVKSAG